MQVPPPHLISSFVVLPCLIDHQQDKKKKEKVIIARAFSHRFKGLLCEGERAKRTAVYEDIQKRQITDKSAYQQTSLICWQACRKHSHNTTFAGFFFVIRIVFLCLHCIVLWTFALCFWVASLGCLEHIHVFTSCFLLGSFWMFAVCFCIFYICGFVSARNAADLMAIFSYSCLYLLVFWPSYSYCSFPSTSLMSSIHRDSNHTNTVK